MSREAHIKTSLSGSPKDFAHVNKFSILSPDDNESPRGCCASKTHVKESVLTTDAEMNELMNALHTALETSFQSPRIRYIEAERSSSFVRCGVRQRQQRIPSREWIRLEKIERDHGLGIS